MSTTLPLSTPVIPDPGDIAFKDNFADSIQNGILAAQQAAVRSQFGFPLLYPAARTYQILTKSRKAGTIKSLTAKTDAGTLTVAVKINGSAVTGLSAVAVTSTEATTNATAANTIAEGDDIQLTFSSVSGVTEFDFNLWIDVTSVGTA